MDETLRDLTSASIGILIALTLTIYIQDIPPWEVRERILMLQELHNPTYRNSTLNETPTSFTNGTVNILGIAKGTYFLVWTGRPPLCMNIQETLNTCAHEWAHNCEHLKDGREP